MDLNKALDDRNTLAGTVRSNVRALMHATLESNTPEDLAGAECGALAMFLALFKSHGVDPCGALMPADEFQRVLTELSEEAGMPFIVLLPEESLNDPRSG